MKTNYPNEQEILSESFLSKYRGKQPNWGFSGLGQIIFARTYSRTKENGEKETWNETLERCIRAGQKLGAKWTKEEAERLFDHLFHLRCSFAGRSLWQLGTKTVDRFGANSLINCFYTNIESPEDFCFIFENLMMGSGVGGSVRREHIHNLPKIRNKISIQHIASKDADFIVPDSREGWVELLRRVLHSAFVTNKGFTYSTILVRGYGELIKSFGGTSSGPQILIDGIEKIVNIINRRSGKKLRSIDVLDIFNIIGSIVVAGNVRRSSEIALGDADDILFLKAKRWDLDTIPNWRAMSNNTICADSYDYTSNTFWEGYHGNGECYGLFNLKLSQTVGRLGEKITDNCEGTNPCCFAEDQDIFVWEEDTSSVDGRKIKNIRDIDGSKRIYVNEFYGFMQCSAYTRVGIYPTCTLTLSSPEGHDIKISVTDNHKFQDYHSKKMIEVKHLKNLNIKFLSGINNTFWTIKNIDIHNILKEVGCIEVPNINKFALTNGLISGNSEISLASGEACNLSDLFMNNISSQEEMIDCAKLMYKLQKAICAMNYLHEKSNKIIHKNMRIGIGITGICQSLDKIKWLDAVYKAIREYDKEWSKENGWNTSIKITTVKPSGTLSLLSGSTPGIHPAYDEYYIRRVRMSSSDDLVKLCRDAGYHTEYVKGFDGKEDYNTVIVEFPCFAGNNAVLAKNMTAIDQLELTKTIQTVWADNAVSVTVYYSKEELPLIQKWLEQNYEHSIKCISFMLRNDHGFLQAPYESISKEEYVKLTNKIKPFALIQSNDNQILDIENCINGACPVR